jgi:hypothetical protein
MERHKTWNFRTVSEEEGQVDEQWSIPFEDLQFDEGEGIAEGSFGIGICLIHNNLIINRYSFESYLF